MLDEILQKSGMKHLIASRSTPETTRTRTARRDQAWVMCMMLIHMDLSFLDHRSLGQVRTAYELFGKLKQLSKPFPFMKLSRELRDKGYEVALVDRSQPKIAFWRTLDRPGGRHLDYQPLLQVSRQVREEGDEIYWGKNEWHVELDHKHEDGDRWETDPERTGTELKQWVQLVGRNRLKHLKDLTLDINLSLRPFGDTPYKFRIRLRENSTLSIELPEYLSRRQYD